MNKKDLRIPNSHKLIVLNSIIHPLVKKLITEQIGQLKCDGGYDYIFIEAALLIEDHYNIICDELWFVCADESVRRKRLIESRGYSEQKVDEIFANQLTEEEFKRYCQYTIYNDRDIDYTMIQLQNILGNM